jgi:hypothetical protein
MISGPFENPGEDKLDGLDSLPGLPSQDDGNVLSSGATFTAHNFISIRRIVQGMSTSVKEYFILRKLKVTSGKGKR